MAAELSEIKVRKRNKVDFRVNVVGAMFIGLLLLVACTPGTLTYGSPLAWTLIGTSEDFADDAFVDGLKKFGQSQAIINQISVETLLQQRLKRSYYLLFGADRERILLPVPDQRSGPYEEGDLRLEIGVAAPSNTPTTTKRGVTLDFRGLVSRKCVRFGTLMDRFGLLPINDYRAPQNFAFIVRQSSNRRRTVYFTNENSSTSCVTDLYLLEYPV